MKTEFALQRAVALWLKNNGFFKQPGGADRLHTPRHYNTFVSSGYEVGTPDLFVAAPCRGYHGLYIEFKASEKEVLSDAQLFLKDKLEGLGYCYYVSWEYETTIAFLQLYAFEMKLGKEVYNKYAREGFTYGGLTFDDLLAHREKSRLPDYNIQLP